MIKSVVTIRRIESFKMANPNNQILSLKNYDDCVKYVLYKYYPHFANIFIRNAEEFSYVVHSAIAADYRYDGRGTQSGYRVYCIKRAIRKSMSNLMKQRKKIKNIYTSTEMGHGRYTLGDLLPNPQNEEEKIDNAEEVKYLIDNASLTETQKSRLYRHYFHRMSLREIAQEDNVTYQAVGKTIQQAIEQIRSSNSQYLK